MARKSFPGDSTWPLSGSPTFFSPDMFITPQTLSTQPAKSMHRSWHKAWKNVTVSFRNYLMSEWMNTWKQSSWAQSTWRQNHITLSSWVTSCLSQYSKSLSRWEQTIPCHVMHGGNAQINKQCSSALIFKRREPYTSLWDAVLTLTSRTEKSHYLHGWLPEMKWVDFSGTVCSHPGSRREVCRERDHLPETPLLDETGEDPFPKMSIKWVASGPKRGPSCHLHPGGTFAASGISGKLTKRGTYSWFQVHLGYLAK